MKKIFKFDTKLSTSEVMRIIHFCLRKRILGNAKSELKKKVRRERERERERERREEKMEMEKSKKMSH